MASACKSSSVNDTLLPVRPTFTNLYKWPESDVEFVKTVNSSNCEEGPHHVHPRGVDSFSCRQTYLKSYTFSRKKVGVTEKTIKCLHRIKLYVFCVSKRLNLKGSNKMILGKAKDVTDAAVAIFHRLLSRFGKFDPAQWFIVISIL